MKLSGVVPVLIVLFVPAYFAATQREAPNDAHAADVMRQVVAAYHSLSTYSDKGTSIIHLDSVEYRIDYETLFKRPGRLRFAWTVEYNQTPGHKEVDVIWSDGTKAWASYSFHGNKLEPKKDLGLAMAGAIAASWGTVNTIPRLLTDDVRGVRLDELNRLRIMGNETVDGVGCSVLAGYFATGGECKVWVGRGDYLIRRIEERGETFKREEVRTQIAVNQEIADSRFSERGY